MKLIFSFIAVLFLSSNVMAEEACPQDIEGVWKCEGDTFTLKYKETYAGRALSQRGFGKMIDLILNGPTHDLVTGTVYHTSCEGGTKITISEEDDEVKQRFKYYFEKKPDMGMVFKVETADGNPMKDPGSVCVKQTRFLSAP